MVRFCPSGLGWLPDVPDFRDLTYQSEEVQGLLGVLDPVCKNQSHDLSDFLPVADDQGPLQSSSAHACAKLLEYAEERSNGHTDEHSRLFLYKMARQIDGHLGDNGASIRSTLKSLKRHGVPPQQTWPYDPMRFDEDPAPPAIYSYAPDFAQLTYFKLHGGTWPGPNALEVIRSFLDAQYPVVFGFTVPTSISREPIIDFHKDFDGSLGGQVALAIGYNDNQTMPSGAGALHILNSWGSTWGDRGRGWLSYRFIDEGYAGDFWTAVMPEWLTSGEFKRPSVIPRR